MYKPFLAILIIVLLINCGEISQVRNETPNNSNIIKASQTFGNGYCPPPCNETIEVDSDRIATYTIEWAGIDQYGTYQDIIEEEDYVTLISGVQGILDLPVVDCCVERIAQDLPGYGYIIETSTEKREISLDRNCKWYTECEEAFENANPAFGSIIEKYFGEVK